MMIDMIKKQIRTGKGETKVKWREDSKELRQRKRERRWWWESGWIQNRKRWRKAAKKIYLQFGHASKEKLKRMVKEAYGRNKKK